MLAPRELPALSPMRRLAGQFRFSLRKWGVLQALGVAVCVIRVAWGRLWHPLGGEARDLNEARLLSRTLGVLKGPFAKLGQFASLRVDLLSPPVREALSELRDRVPPLPFAWIREVVEAELGRPLEACFSAFDPIPLGTASIAQVHRARLADGTELAVKVQHQAGEADGPASGRTQAIGACRVVGCRA